MGGRAGSFRDATTGQVVDCCQHLSLGACTQFAEFRARTGIDDAFRRHGELHFFDPQGRRYDLAAVGWLPSPLHLLPGLLRLGFLTIGQRLTIIRTMGRLMGHRPTHDEPTAGQWLREQGESAESIARFWSLIVASALGNEPDRVSLSAVRKVFREGFLGSRHAYELELPTVPLAELFDVRVASFLAERGVILHRGQHVRQVEGNGTAARGIVLADGSRRQFDFVIVAVPWRRVAELLSPPLRTALPEVERLQSIRPSPITAVHLWFDRPIMDLPHAVLVGRLSHWVFQGSGEEGLGEEGLGIGDWGLEEETTGGGDPTHHAPPVSRPSSPVPRPSSPVPRPSPPVPLQVVISASHDLVGRDRDEIVRRVCEELRETFAGARDAKLLHARVLTQPAAVFCCEAGVEELRPVQVTRVANLFLAGDWTATDWPATMEGAVRSGYRAVEGI
jgi:hypothetical protein